MQSFVAARRAHRRENEGLLIRRFLEKSSGSIGCERSGAPARLEHDPMPPVAAYFPARQLDWSSRRSRGNLSIPTDSRSFAVNKR